MDALLKKAAEAAAKELPENISVEQIETIAQAYFVAGALWDRKRKGGSDDLRKELQMHQNFLIDEASSALKNN